MQKIIFILVLPALLLAEVEDKFKLQLGIMFPNTFETYLQLNTIDASKDDLVNAQNELQLTQTITLDFKSYYRFNNTHSIEAEIFSLRSSGDTSASKNFEFDNKMINIGAKVQSHYNQDIYKINYAYSFHHTKNVEIALNAGLHVTHFDVGLYAEGNINDISDTYTESIFKTTLPLPTLGFKVEYTILYDTLFTHFNAQYFLLAVDSFSGSLNTSELGLEYRFVDHVGMGINYTSNFMQLRVQNSTQELKIDNRIQGLEFYVTYVY